MRDFYHAVKCEYEERDRQWRTQQAEREREWRAEDKRQIEESIRRHSIKGWQIALWLLASNFVTWLVTSLLNRP